MIRSIATSVFILFLLVSCNSNSSYTDVLREIELAETQLRSQNEGTAEAVETLSTLYAQFAQQWPDSAQAALFEFNRANLLAEYKGDYQACITGLENLLQRWPESDLGERAQFLIGYTYANPLQDSSNARKAYERFLERYPNSELAASVRFEISILGKSLDALDSLIQHLPRE